MGDVEVQVATLRRALYNLHDQVRRQEKWIDTFSAPLHRRIVWWLQGYRWKTLGRWRGTDTSQWPPRST